MVHIWRGDVPMQLGFSYVGLIYLVILGVGHVGIHLAHRKEIGSL